jgi:hypothetical protein
MGVYRSTTARVYKGGQHLYRLWPLLRHPHGRESGYRNRSSMSVIHLLHLYLYQKHVLGSSMSFAHKLVRSLGMSCCIGPTSVGQCGTYVCFYLDHEVLYSCPWVLRLVFSCISFLHLLTTLYGFGCRFYWPVARSATGMGLRTRIGVLRGLALSLAIYIIVGPTSRYGKTSKASASRRRRSSP